MSTEENEILEENIKKHIDDSIEKIGNKLNYFQDEFQSDSEKNSDFRSNQEVLVDKINDLVEEVSGLREEIADIKDLLERLEK